MSCNEVESLYYRLNAADDEIENLKETVSEQADEIDNLELEINLLKSSLSELQNGLDQIYSVLPLIATNKVNEVQVSDKTHLHLVLKNER